ncbi:hypothetical protein QBC32DRAFT_352031 [Pseudoneurospora amorphoporcata]|uniref:Uncharacterized protein n=1 Tax=Pseudoneurospora amorphoporcata TaxID=241081 RepID=A0AAN6NLU5_9PEZI|nr:hypothetical protein QBC32DRAFT_352031 [Pseudoneurospora amorphoporcata]
MERASTPPAQARRSTRSTRSTARPPSPPTPAADTRRIVSSLSPIHFIPISITK